MSKKYRNRKTEKVCKKWRITNLRLFAENYKARNNNPANATYKKSEGDTIRTLKYMNTQVCWFMRDRSREKIFWADYRSKNHAIVHGCQNRMRINCSKCVKQVFSISITLNPKDKEIDCKVWMKPKIIGRSIWLRNKIWSWIKQQIAVLTKWKNWVWGFNWRSRCRTAAAGKTI